MTTQAELAAALQIADDAWQADLVKHFGEHADTMRYSLQGKVGPLSATYNVRKAARVAWEAVAFAA
jgi:hypothetical protein